MTNDFFSSASQKLKVLALALSYSLGAHAADHRDGPFATNDPAADLNDVYLFVNPRNAAETILIATVAPFSTAL